MGARGPQPARQLVDGRWMTLAEVAKMLGKHHNTLICYMADHPGIGYQVIADRYRAGEVRRGGIHPTKRHRVHGKLLTVREAAAKYKLNAHTLYWHMERGRTLQQAVDTMVKRRQRRAEREILRILTGGQEHERNQTN